MSLSCLDFVKESLSGNQSVMITPLPEGVKEIVCPECHTVLKLQPGKGQPGIKIFGRALLEIHCTNRNCSHYKKESPPIVVMISTALTLFFLAMPFFAAKYGSMIYDMVDDYFL